MADGGALIHDVMAEGHAFLRSNQLDNAEAAFRAHLGLHPDSTEALIGLMWVAHGRSSWSDALVLAEQVVAIDPTFEAPWLVTGIAQVRLGNRPGAQTAFAQLLLLAPDNPIAWDEVLKFAETREDWATVEVEARRYGLVAPDQPHATVALARSFYRRGRRAEAMALLDEGERRWPSSIEVAIEQARLESWFWRHDAAEQRWDDAVALRPGSFGAFLGWMASASMTSRFAEIDARYAQWMARRELDEDQAVYFRVAYAKSQVARYDFHEADRVLDGAWETASRPGLQQVVMATRAEVVLRGQEPQRLTSLAEQFAELGYFDQGSGSAWLQYFAARLLVQSNRADEAMAFVDGLADWSRDTALVLELRSWVAMQRGDVVAAKALYAHYRRQAWIPQLETPVDDLRLVAGSPVFPTGSVVAICVVRNERLRIDAVLDHHRSLGVEHFMVVDNGSDDGTLDLLLAHDDVTVFATTDDYVRAGLGMRWVNELIDRHLSDHWCLFIDADELLVYPDYETQPLRTLVADAEQQGAEVIAGFMLDMHPADRTEDVSWLPVTNAGDLIESSPYFEANYRSTPTVRSPYFSVKGGFRETAGFPYREQTKTPLVKTASGVRFTSSSHEITPAIVADRRVALLHFKFMADATARAEAETQWTSYSYYASRKEGFDRLDAARFSSPSSVRFTGSRQLVELGLIW